MHVQSRTTIILLPQDHIYMYNIAYTYLAQQVVIYHPKLKWPHYNFETHSTNVQNAVN